MSSSLNSSVENKKADWLAKSMRIEWLGQTIASLCWIFSMLLYGLNSGADWLQLIAGVAWLFANISSLNEA